MRRRRNNSGILIAIVALAAAIAYVFSSLFGGFGPGEAGGGAPVEVDVGVGNEAPAEPAVEAEPAEEAEGVEAVEYVFDVPANDDIRYNGEAIDFAQYEALVAEAAERRATIRLIRDPSVSVEFGERLREVVNELNVEYVEE